MSGASENTHLVGGANNTFQNVVDTGHAQTESSYDQFIAPVRKQFPATRNVPVQLENIPCAKVIIQNPIGNDAIYVGGLAEQTPYYDLNYVGDYRGAVLYEGMSDVFQVTNANRLQVVGTPLQSFSYKAYPNVPQKILTDDESPPNPDTFAPEVLFSDPADESTGILITRTEFSITMDEPILPSSVNIDNVTISPAITYDVFPDPVNDSRIKIVLLEPLVYATLYTISVVVGGLKDFSENAVDELAEIQFTTEAAPPPPPPPDVTAPTAQATNPIDSATSVPRDKIVTITMSEAMLPASINTTNVTVSPAIDYDVFLNPVNSSQIIINHSVLFSYNTLYTITLISGGVKDTSNNGIAAPFVFDFTIEVQPSIPDVGAPTVSSIDPVNGATGVVRNKTISITMSEPILEASITTTNIVLAPLIAYSVFRDPTNTSKIILDPSADLPASQLHTITLTANGIKDLSDNGVAAQSFNFTTEAAPPPADVTPPTITARSPAISATNVTVDSDITVDFNEALLVPIPANSFELFAPGPTEVTAVTITEENGNAKLRMNPNSNLSFNTAYTVFVRTTIEDAAGNNLASQSSWSFTTAAAPPAVDTTPPTVIAQTPTSGSLNVARNTTIIVDFSESMDTSTVHGNSVELYRVSNSQKLVGSIAFSSISGQSNRRVTLTPTALLEYGVQYQAFVRTTVKDVAGNALALEVNWLFTVTTALAIVARTPASSASNQSTTTNITVDFNKAINTATVTTSTFELFNVSTGVEVSPVIFSFANGNQQVIMNPTPALDFSTQYQMVVRSTVADTLGNTLGSDDSWFFTTVIQFDISNRDPAVDAINVPISSPIVIDFTKALNTTTITSNTVELFDTTTSGEKTCNRVLSQGNTRVTATPTTSLVYSRRYEMVVRAGSAGVKASDGSLMPAERRWFFTTESDPITIELLYSVSGSGDWEVFGDTGGGSNDRHGRGLKITTTTTGVTNALYHTKITEYRAVIRRDGSDSSRDDQMYLRIRSSSGTLRRTLNMTSPSSVHNISSGSSGTTVTFADPDNDYICVQNDHLHVEYDDGDDDFRFEMNQQSSGSASSHSVESYSDGEDDLFSTSLDAGAVIFGERT